MKSNEKPYVKSLDAMNLNSCRAESVSGKIKVCSYFLSFINTKMAHVSHWYSTPPLTPDAVGGFLLSVRGSWHLCLSRSRRVLSFFLLLGNWLQKEKINTMKPDYHSKNCCWVQKGQVQWILSTKDWIYVLHDPGTYQFHVSKVTETVNLKIFDRKINSQTVWLCCSCRWLFARLQ